MKILYPGLLLFALLLSSCSTTPSQTEATAQPKPETQAKPVNPFPPGTYAHFKAEPPYPRTMKTWKNDVLLAQVTPQNSRVIIDLATQRGFLMLGPEVAMDYRISTGRSGHRTPPGRYTITEKIVDKRSNLYGKIYNSSGKLVKSNADSRKHNVPAGGKFVGASMKYWMRLTGDGIGMHRGAVANRYASHGCIRTHSSAVSTVYSKVKIGTPVSVVSSGSPATRHAPLPEPERRSFFALGKKKAQPSAP